MSSQDNHSENSGVMTDPAAGREPMDAGEMEVSVNHHTGLEPEELRSKEKPVQADDSPHSSGAGRQEPGGGESLGGAARNDRSKGVYDEYRELLEETRQTHTIEDEPVGPPLDINLLSSLVYWTALAKQQVGEDQLKDILQLYIQSGHSRPELQDLLLQISRMVDADPPLLKEGPREWVDLMFHLHGILTGGFPVIKVPHIRLSTHSETGEEGA